MVQGTFMCDRGSSVVGYFTNNPRQKSSPTRQSPAKKISSARELSAPAGSEHLFVLGYHGQGMLTRVIGGRGIGTIG